MGLKNEKRDVFDNISSFVTAFHKGTDVKARNLSSHFKLISINSSIQWSNLYVTAYSRLC